MDEKLLTLLACPACQGDVQLKDNKIVCTRCHRSYPIIDGIPVLLVDQLGPHAGHSQELETGPDDQGTCLNTP